MQQKRKEKFGDDRKKCYICAQKTTKVRKNFLMDKETLRNHIGNSARLKRIRD